ncbi:MAG TPA: hypothetical protein VKW04_18915 [Planctomycetota bacterium]|nr:hypothetical protein [Planctomycetota bacterium]
MKKIILGLALLLGAPLAVCADVTKEDVRKLCAAGISDSLIVNYVKSNGPLQKLSTGDLLDLRHAGASDSLLFSLLALETLPPAPADDLSSAPPDLAVTSIPSTDPSTTIYNEYYPTVSYVVDGSTYCPPSIGVVGDGGGSVVVGGTIGRRGSPNTGATSGDVNHAVRPHPAPPIVGATSGAASQPVRPHPAPPIVGAPAPSRPVSGGSVAAHSGGGTTVASHSSSQGSGGASSGDSRGGHR